MATVSEALSQNSLYCDWPARKNSERADPAYRISPLILGEALIGVAVRWPTLMKKGLVL